MRTRVFTLNTKAAVRRASGLSTAGFLKDTVVEDGNLLWTRTLISGCFHIHKRIILRVGKPNDFYFTVSIHVYLCIYGLHLKRWFKNHKWSRILHTGPLTQLWSAAFAGRYHQLLTNIGSWWPTIRWNFQPANPWRSPVPVTSKRFAAFSPPTPPSVVYSASELNLSQLPWRPAHCSGILPPADPRNLSSVFFPPAPASRRDQGRWLQWFMVLFFFFSWSFFYTKRLEGPDLYVDTQKSWDNLKRTMRLFLFLDSY